MQPNFERRGDFQGLVTNILLLNNIEIVVLKNNYILLAIRVGNKHLPM